MNDHPNRARERSGRRPPPFARNLAAIVLATVAPALPLIPPVLPILLAAPASAGDGHPRWKEFVTWLSEKKRTPEEDLILRYILSGARRMAWLDVYAHSMQEQTEALFRRWLDREGNSRRNPNLGTTPPGDTRR